MRARGLAIAVLITSAAVTGGVATALPAAAAPATTTAASCSVGHVTYERTYVALAEKKFVLGPGRRKHTGEHLHKVRTVRANAPGLGRGSGIIHSIRHHWQVPDARQLGSVTTIQAPGEFSLPHAKHDIGIVVLDYVRYYHGAFTGRCGSRQVTGSYRTFGVYGVAGVRCDEPATDRVTRIGKTYC